MSNELINQIANIVLVILMFPIGYLTVMNIWAFFKPNIMKKIQKERESKSCRVHSYERAGPIRICTECGYCPDTKYYFDTNLVKIQIDLNKELKKIDEEKEEALDIIIARYGIDKDKLNSLSNELTKTSLEFNTKKINKANEFREMRKEQDVL